MMNKRLRRTLVVVVTLWVVIFGGFIAWKESVLRSGTEIVLATVPVDPRDLLRGDYVILQYDISRLEERYVSEIVTVLREKNIYVLLDTTGSVARVVGVQQQRPSSGVFIRGKLQSPRVPGNPATVLYGIESYFVPEGEGKVIERARGGSLTVRVSVDNSGSAIIKELLLDGVPVTF